MKVAIRRLGEAARTAPPTPNVRCPALDRNVSLDVCTACLHCDEIRLDASGHDSFLVCSGPARHPSPGHVPEASAPRELREPPAPAVSAVSAVSVADARSTAVAAIMTRRVLVARPEDSLEHLVALLVEHGVSGVPVVDDGGRPVGLVSKTDLLRIAGLGAPAAPDPAAVATGPAHALRFRTEGGFEITFGSGVDPAVVRSARVADLMTPLAFTVTETASIALAAALMVYEGVHRVPVVDGEGRVAGILSALDVLRWLTIATGLPPARAAREAS